MWWIINSNDTLSSRDDTRYWIHEGRQYEILTLFKKKTKKNPTTLSYYSNFTCVSRCVHRIRWMDYDLTRNIFTLPLTAQLMKDCKTQRSLWLTWHLFVVLEWIRSFLPIFYVIIPGIFWLVGPIASSNWSKPELEQAINLSLLPTHALQKPCQHLKSTQAYFSQGG